MCSITFYLLIRRDGAKDDFRKIPRSEFSVCYATNDLQRHTNDGERSMVNIVDQTGDVVFGHFRELSLEQIFETCEDNCTLSTSIIVGNAKFDLAIDFFYNCRL